MGNIGTWCILSPRAYKLILPGATAAVARCGGREAVESLASAYSETIAYSWGCRWGLLTRHASRDRAIPVSSSSGRMEEGWPRTATLRACMRPSLATNAAPMAQLFLSEPSVPTTLPLFWSLLGPQNQGRIISHRRKHLLFPFVSTLFQFQLFYFS